MIICLKDYRSKEMKYLLAIYFLLFLLWSTSIFEKIPITIEKGYKIIISIIEGVAISGVLSLITFLGDSLISSKLKDDLVSLFLIPRSGQTIFTQISNKTIKDDRFLVSEAIVHYSETIENRPTKKKERLHYENACWYKVYCEYKTDGAVMQAHKDYLLCRDLYIETIEFMIIYIIALFLFTETIVFSYRFILTLLAVAIITNISTHIKMGRFVNTVIAVDISNKIRRNIL